MKDLITELFNKIEQNQNNFIIEELTSFAPREAEKEFDIKLIAFKKLEELTWWEKITRQRPKELIANYVLTIEKKGDEWTLELTEKVRHWSGPLVENTPTYTFIAKKKITKDDLLLPQIEKIYWQKSQQTFLNNLAKCDE